jgi:hypothetical protein
LTPEQIKEEALIFTPPGFKRAGEPKWDGEGAWFSEGRTGHVEIVVRDAATGHVTPCRVNVVGKDGHYYQPPPVRLSRFALTGVLAAGGMAWGNKPDKAPYRYLGRFFYTTGEAEVRAPAGPARIEVWRGFEYHPETVSVQVPPGSVQRVEIKLTRSAPMAAAGYYAGDSHLHFFRENDEDDTNIFDVIDILNSGYRFAAHGASDYPGARPRTFSKGVHRRMDRQSRGTDRRPCKARLRRESQGARILPTGARPTPQDPRPRRDERRGKLSKAQTATT